MNNLENLSGEAGAPSLRAIVRAFGGVLLADGRSALIPGPGHSKRDRSVSLRQLPNGRILIHCFSPKDDWREVQAMLEAHCAIVSVPDAACPPSDEVDASGERKILRVRKLWSDAVPVEGSRAETYLRGRGIHMAAWPSALRFLPHATSLDDRRKRPALVAAITNRQGELHGIQITLLTPCGRHKASIATPRRVIGNLSGAAVRLCDGSDQGVLIVGEGVETALSASDALGAPAWSALNASNLARFDPPGWVRRLIIAADRGPAGEAAAETLVKRMSGRGLPAETILAPGANPDWNDWARRRR